jgi:hypothetical protein
MIVEQALNDLANGSASETAIVILVQQVRINSVC